MTSTLDTLKELARLREQATPAPWEMDKTTGAFTLGAHYINAEGECSGMNLVRTSSQDRASDDFAFIAACGSVDWKAVCEEVERATTRHDAVYVAQLRSDLAEVRSRLESLKGHENDKCVEAWKRREEAMQEANRVAHDMMNAAERQQHNIATNLLKERFDAERQLAAAKEEVERLIEIDPSKLGSVAPSPSNDDQNLAFANETSERAIRKWEAAEARAERYRAALENVVSLNACGAHMDDEPGTCDVCDMARNARAALSETGSE